MSRSSAALFSAKLGTIVGAICFIVAAPIASVSVVADGGVGQNWSTPSTDDGNPWDGSTDGNPWDG